MKNRSFFIIEFVRKIFENIFKEIKSIPFHGIKNVSYLAVGNFVTQIIMFFGGVYIARLLGPTDYGIYVTVGAFVGIFEFLLLGGLNKSVMREGSKDLSMMCVQLEKTIGLRNILILVATISCIILSFFTPYEAQTKIYIFLFSFQLVHAGLKGFLTTIYQATEKMKYISIFSIANRLMFVSLSITFLYLGFGLLSLFLISLISNLTTILINYRVSQKLVKFKFFARVQIDKKLVYSALIFSLINFVDYLTTQIDLLMISWMGTSSDVGIYGVAYRLAHEGMILRNFVATAFFPIFIKRLYGKSMEGSRLIRISLLFLFVIFLTTFAISLFVEDGVIFLFGSEYENSGAILKVLIFYLAFVWASLPFTTAAQATHNEKYFLYVTTIMAGTNIGLNYLFFLWYGLIGIAYSTLVVSLVGSFFICYISYKVMKRQGYLK